MRPQVDRHLGEFLRETGTLSDAFFDAGSPFPDPEFSIRQYAIFLLYVAAEIEHALMVQYLYAGFCLGGPQVPACHQPDIAQWQEVILGIAKEEMGHLTTVQNLLRCLGAPPNLSRQDFPTNSGFYPFPFCLEPLTRESLAKYICAESPPPEMWTGSEADEIRKLAREAAYPVPVNRVGDLNVAIQTIFKLLKETDFHASTYPLQANLDEWGRGYQDGARGQSAPSHLYQIDPRFRGTPNVIITPVASRSNALSAIEQIASQGEANPTVDTEAPSHFARLLYIFRGFPCSWSPSREVAVNPIVGAESASADATESWRRYTRITHPEARLWAHLFNVRYRMLLTDLLHTFHYSSNLSERSQLTPRGLLLHATFGEMYNLRALSRILVDLPASAHTSGGTRAGPPFQMPYTLDLPLNGANRWRLHLDLLEASDALLRRLLVISPASRHVYLRSLRDGDCRMKERIEAVLSNKLIPSDPVPESASVT